MQSLKKGGPMSQDSSTSKASAHITSSPSISSAAASPAKTSASEPEEKNADSTSNDQVSGSSTQESSENYSLVGSSLRTFLTSKLKALTQSSLIWKEQATPAGHPWWVLKPSVRHSNGNVFSSSRITTPTALNALEPTWADSGRFHLNSKGRWRKRAKTGITGSMNWAQEMLVRAVVQKNPNLTPTPTTCEQFMGFPIGHTDLKR